MSHFGTSRFELERQRRQRLVREQRTREALALQAESEAAFAETQASASVPAARAELVELRRELDRAQAVRAQDPEQALEVLRGTLPRIHAAATVSRVANERLRRLTLEASVLGAELRAAREAIGRLATGPLGNTEAALRQAQRLLEGGALEEGQRALERGREFLVAAHEAAEREEVRRTVVAGLLRALRRLDFVVSKPRLVAGQGERHVRLEGMLPSGKQAVFRVALDGELHFDFDGYEGRACKDTLDLVTDELRERCLVEVGPHQITWKNPDRLQQGARPLPATQGRHVPHGDRS